MNNVSSDANNTPTPSKRGRPRKIKKAQLVAAIKGSGGQRSIISKELNISIRTLDRYLERFSDAKELYYDEIESTREDYKSLAHQGLRKALEKGEAWAVKLVLTTLGKDEGFAERNEYSGPDGGPFELNVNIVTDDTPLKDREDDY